MDQIYCDGFPAWFRTRALARSILRVLRDLREAPSERIVLSISCVSAAEMTHLNQKYRRKRGVTDVLSFEQAAHPGGPLKGVRYLGDIVICEKVLRRQASEQKHAVRTELAVLLTHGILHLLGWDHERSAREEKKMALLESLVLGRLENGSSRKASGLLVR